MEIFSVDTFFKKINFLDYNLRDFYVLSNATSNVIIPDTETLEMNFQRGILLYALIGYKRPETILEFGTGGGFSALCMAKALCDFKIDGKIYTIDRIGNDEKTYRLYQLPNSDKPSKRKVSNKENWESTVSSNIIEKIIPIKGYSGVAMDKVHFKNIDFCYIDGVHTYDGTKHDFFSFLKLASNSFSVLFDDYIERKSYGVKEFVDKEIKPNFDIEMIKLDNELITRKKIQNNPGMIFLDHKSNSPAISMFDKKIINEFLKKYRLIDEYRSRRYNLEKKLPFVKNIKFKFWK